MFNPFQQQPGVCTGRDHFPSLERIFQEPRDDDDACDSSSADEEESRQTLLSDDLNISCFMPFTPILSDDVELHHRTLREDYDQRRVREFWSDKTRSALSNEANGREPSVKPIVLYDPATETYPPLPEQAQCRFLPIHEEESLDVTERTCMADMFAQIHLASPSPAPSRRSVVPSHTPRPWRPSPFPSPSPSPSPMLQPMGSSSKRRMPLLSPMVPLRTPVSSRHFGSARRKKYAGPLSSPMSSPSPFRVSPISRASQGMALHLPSPSPSPAFGRFTAATAFVDLKCASPFSVPCSPMKLCSDTQSGNGDGQGEEQECVHQLSPVMEMCERRFSHSPLKKQLSLKFDVAEEDTGSDEQQQQDTTAHAHDSSNSTLSSFNSTLCLSGSDTEEEVDDASVAGGTGRGVQRRTRSLALAAVPQPLLSPGPGPSVGAPSQCRARALRSSSSPVFRRSRSDGNIRTSLSVRPSSRCKSPSLMSPLSASAAVRKSHRRSPSMRVLTPRPLNRHNHHNRSLSLSHSQSPSPQSPSPLYDAGGRQSPTCHSFRPLKRTKSVESNIQSPSSVRGMRHPVLSSPLCTPPGRLRRWSEQEESHMEEQVGLTEEDVSTATSLSTCSTLRNWSPPALSRSRGQSQELHENLVPLPPVHEPSRLDRIQYSMF